MRDLIQKVESFGSPRVALVGDFMLDRYVYGDAERISPEAPVPVLCVSKQENRTGGAGNVAAAIAALGAKVACVGIMGHDDVGAALDALLRKAGADTGKMLRLPDRPTTIKTRYVGLAQHRHAQQMIRVDSECTESLPRQAQDSVIHGVRQVVGECGVLAIEDYDKGVCSDYNTPAIIAAARAAGLKVLVDPARIRNYARYRGATLLTPNRYEAELASGVTITDDRSLREAAQKIVQAAQAQAVVITLDKEGAYAYEASGLGQRVPTRPRAVYDVTGAGDEVLAALAVGLAQGMELVDAVALANVAGGLEVERFGVVPITRQELLEELRAMIGLRGSKVMTRAKLAEEVARRKARGELVAFTNGCFDILHMGHVRYLQQARQLGSCLVVAINSDASVRKVKGAGRPVISQSERAEMLGALECVDFVTIFDEETPIPLLELLRPDLLIKGGSTPVVVGRELVEAYGGKVMTMDLVDGLSTTSIINKILSNGK